MNTQTVVLTITAPAIEQHALQRLAILREQAQRWHEAALREAGGCTKPWPQMIDVAFDDVRAVGLLSSLLLSMGDGAASARIGGAVDLLLDELTELAYQARMVSIPGWDHATQAFTQPADGATPARTSH